MRRHRNQTIAIGISLVAAVSLALAGRGFRDTALEAREQVADRLNGLATSDPTVVASVGPAKDDTAANTLDHRADTWWQPGADAQVTYKFATPVRLVRIQIVPGKSDDEAQFKSMSRPAQIEVKAISETRDEPIRQIWKLKDEPGTQTLDMAVSGVKEVSMKVLDKHPGNQSQEVAVNEVAFLVRNTSG